MRFRRSIIQILVVSILYVLLGNARSIQPHPFFQGTDLAVTMIIPVIAGILFGWRVGLVSGVIGSILQYFSPGGSFLDLYRLIPNAIMGFTAGHLKFSPVFAAFTIALGNIIIIILFLISNIISIHVLSIPSFWFGFFYEIFIEYVAILLIVNVYRLGVS